MVQTADGSPEEGASRNGDNTSNPMWAHIMRLLDDEEQAAMVFQIFKQAREDHQPTLASVINFVTDPRVWQGRVLTIHENMRVSQHRYGTFHRVVAENLDKQIAGQFQRELLQLICLGSGGQLVQRPPPRGMERPIGLQCPLQFFYAPRSQRCF